MMRSREEEGTRLNNQSNLPLTNHIHLLMRTSGETNHACWTPRGSDGTPEVPDQK